MLNRWLFGGDSSLVRDVYVAGERLVHESTHPAEDDTAAAFSDVMRALP